MMTLGRESTAFKTSLVATPTSQSACLRAMKLSFAKALNSRQRYLILSISTRDCSTNDLQLDKLDKFGAARESKRAGTRQQEQFVDYMAPKDGTFLDDAFGLVENGRLQ